MKYFTYFLLLIFTQACTQKETFSEEEINEIQKLKSDLDEGFTKIEIEVRSLANALVKGFVKNICGLDLRSQVFQVYDIT